MMKKINIGVLFGGKSIEHEVSLQSARNVIQSLDRTKYTITLMGIDKKGKWGLYDEKDYLIEADNPEEIALNAKSKPIDLLQTLSSLDVVFPVLHGLLGEDGSVQGLLKLANVAFVGADVLGSAIGMDKDVMKRLLRDQNIPTSKFLTVHAEERWSIEEILEQFAFPFFVKPANAGSSIGISKVKEACELDKALQEAFQYDQKVLIEEAVCAREIELSIIDDEEPLVSLGCEIIPKGEFHSYASKYIDPNGAEFIYPADVELGIFLKMRKIALKAYKALCCEGMARVDLFLKPSGEILVNEINTIPGLTNMSPFAKMWEISGMPYPEMLDRLIAHAMKRHDKEQKRVTQINLKSQWITH